MLPLNDKEQAIIALVCAGKSNAEIALIMGISKPVVACYLRVIYPKLDSRNRAEACAQFTLRRFQEQQHLTRH
jgi:DNA-binding CsgD family transcriptional regulator